MSKATNDAKSSPIADAMTRLGFQLCLNGDPEKNVVLSPLGIIYMLAMLYLGARGKSRRQLAQVIGGNSDDLLLEHIDTLVREIEARSQLTNYEASVVRRRQAKREELLAQGIDPQAVEEEVYARIGSIGMDSPNDLRFLLSVANNIWVQQSYRLKQEFLKQTRGIFDVDVGLLDFRGKPDEACRVVNAWISDNTQGVIDSMITPDMLSSLTRVVLANAIYFKAFWASNFSPPQPGPFHLINGKTIEAQMMHKTGYLGYMESKEFRAVVLPYKQRPVSMCLVLPRMTGMQALVDLERLLARGDRENLLAAADRRYVHLTMPEYEFGFEADLVPMLSWVGLQELFSGGDFSGISNEEGFGIDCMLHQASIHVDRFGTVAVAGTVTTLIGAATPKEIMELMVDRPFLFLILDEPTGAALFVGRVMDPR